MKIKTLFGIALFTTVGAIGCGGEEVGPDGCSDVERPYILALQQNPYTINVGQTAVIEVNLSAISETKAYIDITDKESGRYKEFLTLVPADAIPVKPGTDGATFSVTGVKSTANQSLDITLTLRCTTKSQLWRVKVNQPAN